MRMEDARGSIRKPEPDEGTSPVKIAIIGVGGGGSNAVDNMIAAGVKVDRFMAVNTDRQALRVSKAQKRVQIGSGITRGFGAGADASVGQKAAEESRETLETLIRDMDLVFITAGMGGGTGTGAAPVIAEIAHSLGKLTIAFVTTPFTFEGEVRMENAKRGIENLRKFVDSIVIIPNERLATVAKDMTTQKAFEYADDVLRQGVQATTDLIANPGRVNVDFADIRTILSGGGKTIMGIGCANGTNRAMTAVQKAVNNNVLGTSIVGASRVIINIEGKDVKMDEVSRAVEVVRGVCAKGANIIFGTGIVPALEDSIQITIIATGFNKNGEQPAAAEATPAPVTDGATGSPDEQFFDPSRREAPAAPVIPPVQQPVQQPVVQHSQPAPAAQPRRPEQIGMFGNAPSQPAPRAAEQPRRPGKITIEEPEEGLTWWQRINRGNK